MANTLYGNTPKDTYTQLLYLEPSPATNTANVRRDKGDGTQYIAGLDLPITTTQANFLRVTGAVAASPVLVNAIGTDTNIGITVAGKGSGVITLGSNTTVTSGKTLTLAGVTISGAATWVSTQTMDITGNAATATTATTATSATTATTATSATALATPRAINGVNFDGTAAITVTAAAGTLTGATLASGVTGSSLTSVGTLTGLTVGGAFSHTSGSFSVSTSSTPAPGFGAGFTSITRAVKLYATSSDNIANASFSFISDKSNGSNPLPLLVLNGDTTISALFMGKVYPGTDAGAVQTSAGIYAGSGVPSNSNGSNGDYYFRSDGSSSTTHVYFKTAGSWTGIS